MSISDKHKVIYGIAKGLRYGDEKGHKEMKGSELAEILNDLGYLTDDGEKYTVGTIGIFSCISAAYKSFKKHDGDDHRAGWIATAFVDRNGEYAWQE
ncbi:hypothetical protein EXM22_01785 [Oceanispirochaeta crateris]|uniref:Uncharacterized protein n=1 Tax=Oceanispirochaeta crateris TaxID=2518645 RepID=A0A5C1QKW3_9SPIO|nr:hypothetical protein [Oceanispirochaeta crateris]QEN06782.1 hypothetical protein EXM22_01785 [Oceanispirochaeta crateris]